MFDTIKLLIQNYRKIGLTEKEYILLNAILSLNHTDISDMTLSNYIGYSQDKVKSTLVKLIDQGVLVLTDNGLIDIRKFRLFMEMYHRDNMSLAEKMDYDFVDTKVNIGYEQKSDGFFITTCSDYDDDGFSWPIKDMRELAEGLLRFTNTFTEESISEYNQKRKKKHQQDKEEQKRKRIEKEQKKKQREPQPGYMILIKTYPSGLYKFTYTSGDLQSKIGRLHDQFGQSEVIHTIRTTDCKPFHQHLKNMFILQMRDDLSGYWFDLTNDEVNYFKEQNFPPNVMELVD